jgi:hypothetical protein
MKQLPLSDVAIDSAGEVFATKSGDLRLVAGSSPTATWVKGGKKVQLTAIDAQRDEAIIFKDLGVYSFLGTICDDL